MKKLSFLLLSIILFTNSFSLTALADKNLFEVNLDGYQLFVLDDFVGEIDKGKVTPLAKAFLEVLRREQQWVFEPRVYVKGNQGYIHIVKENGLNVLYEIKKIENNWHIVNETQKIVNRIPVPKDLLQQTLVELLVDDITDALNKNGYGRLWYRGSESILSIEKAGSGLDFRVKAQVITFEGAHNPPYGEETMVFLVKSGGEVKLLDFKHRDIPKEENMKLKAK